MRDRFVVVIASGAIFVAGACGLARLGTGAAPQGEGGDSTGVLGGGLGGPGGASGDGGMPQGPVSSPSASSTGGGGAGGIGGEGGTAAPTYLYKMPITIATSGSNTPAGYQISLLFDHAALVTAGKSLASGDDLRLFRDTGGGRVEVDRVLAPFSDWNTTATRIWWRIPDALTEPQTDITFALYYGDPDAGAPPADATAVYDVWDDFDGTTLDSAWTVVSLGNATGTQVAVGGGVVRLTTRSDTIGPDVDDQAFLYRQATGAFVADVHVTMAGGSIGPFPALGGVMVRTDLDADGRMRMISPTDMNYDSMDRWFSDIRRLTDQGSYEFADYVGTPTLPARTLLRRSGTATDTFYSADLVNFFVGDGALAFVGAAPDPVYVGIPLANDDPGADGWVEIDFYRQRKLVTFDPAVTLGAEEPSDL